MSRISGSWKANWGFNPIYLKQILMVLLERKLQLAKIFARLNATRPQSIAIEGDCKTGKTVLLQQILNKDIQQQYLSPDRNYNFFFSDLKETYSGCHNLLADIITSFWPAFDAEKISDDEYYNTLVRIVSADSADSIFVIVLDNFHLLSQDRSVSFDFFSFLRSLANNKQVAYVISFGCNRNELFPVSYPNDEPVINIFSSFMLKPFKDEEAKQWFSLFQPMNIDHELFRKLTGFHPYLMTQLMEVLNRLPGVDNSEALKETLVQNNKGFVLNLLNSLPANHKDVFTNLALGLIPKNNQQYIVNTLVSKGYVDSDWVITSEIIQTAIISLHHEKKWNKFTTLFKRFFYT